MQVTARGLGNEASVYECIPRINYHRIRFVRGGTQIFSTYLFSFRNSFSGMGKTWFCLLHSAMPSPYYRINIISPSSLPGTTPWKIKNALIESEYLSQTLPSLAVESPPKGQGFTGMRPEKVIPEERYVRSVSFSVQARPRSALQNAEASGSNRAHLHLFKVGHRPLVIPAVLL